MMRSWKSKCPPPASTHMVSGDSGTRARNAAALPARPSASSYSPLTNSRETPASAVVEVEVSIERGRHPHGGHTRVGKRLSQNGVLENPLFEHVVLADDNGADAPAVLWNVEECAR